MFITNLSDASILSLARRPVTNAQAIIAAKFVTAIATGVAKNKKP